MSTVPTVTLEGRFMTNTGPLAARMTFTPRVLSFVEGKDEMAVMAREIELDENGYFNVELTPTDSFEIPFKYDVTCTHVGTWQIELAGEGPHQMADLMPRKKQAKKK